MLRRCKSYRASPPDGGLEAETSQKTLKQTLIPAGQRRLPAHTTAGTDTRIGNTHTHTHTEGSCSACSPLGPISVKHFSLPPSTLPPLLFLPPRFLARGYGTAEQSTRQAGTRVPGAIWPPGRCAVGWLLLLWGGCCCCAPQTSLLRAVPASASKRRPLHTLARAS